MKPNELLNSLTLDVQSIIDTVEKEFIPLPDSRLNWKESPDRWSILECFAHLNRYSLYYNTQLGKSIEQARENINSTDEVKSTWLGTKFIGMMHPDNVKRQKTFSRMNPSNSALDRNVFNLFLQHQHELLRLIKRSIFVNLNTTKVPVEFLKLLKLNLGDALQFVVVHEQRHLKQAASLKART